MDRVSMLIERHTMGGNCEKKIMCASDEKELSIYPNPSQAFRLVPIVFADRLNPCHPD